MRLEVRAVRNDKTGTFLGLPYDWRWPTWARVTASVWNPEDRRVFVPKVFGWGWSVNLHALLHRRGRLDH
jgi:hypothetical protein